MNNFEPKSVVIAITLQLKGRIQPAYDLLLKEQGKWFDSLFYLLSNKIDIPSSPPHPFYSYYIIVFFNSIELLSVLSDC